MAQSVFTWVVVYETYTETKRVNHYTCTWAELLDHLDGEPISITRTDTWR